MRCFKVRYISDKESIFFEKGKVYNAYLPPDNESGNVYAFRLEGMDEDEKDSFYALPANRFEQVTP